MTSGEMATGNRGDEAQRDQGQSGRALPRQAGRARHRLGQGQDLGPRRQGPDRAHRRRAQRLRGRPDAAASPAAEARLQQRSSSKDFKVVNLGRLQQALDAGKLERRGRGRRRRAGRRRHAAPRRRRRALWPRASSRRRSPSRSPARPRRRSRRSRRPAARSCCPPAPPPNPRRRNPPPRASLFFAGLCPYGHTGGGTVGHRHIGSGGRIILPG